MPIALDPTQTCEITLDSDADKPADQRPAFIARYLTCREQRSLGELIDAPAEGPAWMETASAILALQLSGWRNVMARDGQPIPFAVTDGKLTAALDVFTPMEIWEIIAKARTAIRLSEEDKKKLAWQRRSAGASSATTATPSGDATNPSATTSSPSPA